MPSPDQLSSARLDLARALWTYGEDQLWPAVLELGHDDIQLIRTVAAARLDDQPERLRRYKRVQLEVLASSAVQILENAPRPLARAEPREIRHMPARLRGW
jgi:hypothetical protein